MPLEEVAALVEDEGTVDVVHELHVEGCFLWMGGGYIQSVVDSPDEYTVHVNFGIEYIVDYY